MKQNWAMILVILFLAAAGAAERGSALYLERLRDKDRALRDQIAELSAREKGAPAERQKYDEIERLARRIQEQIRWEPDSTRVMRSFGDSAARMGVRLMETRMLAVGSEGTVVAGGAYRRMRIETRLTGSFWPLVDYVDDLERNARPMVVESVVLTADRDKSGTGDLRLTVSVLSPNPAAAPGGTGGGK
jgi:hypothetical protein